MLGSKISFNDYHGWGGSDVTANVDPQGYNPICMMEIQVKLDFSKNKSFPEALHGLI